MTNTDAVQARLARKHGCMACAFYKPTVTAGGTQNYGVCVVNPPRTSSAKFPSVFKTDWCGAWTPLVALG